MTPEQFYFKIYYINQKDISLWYDNPANWVAVINVQSGYTNIYEDIQHSCTHTQTHTQMNVSWSPVTETQEIFSMWSIYV
jgi:hypothetical protein